MVKGIGYRVQIHFRGYSYRVQGMSYKVHIQGTVHVFSLSISTIKLIINYSVIHYFTLQSKTIQLLVTQYMAWGTG